jgi:small multidrug resistance family-3 protein
MASSGCEACTLGMNSTAAAEEPLQATEHFKWTTVLVLRAVAVFIAAGFAEILGGWLVWKAVRENKLWWWAVLGSLVLIVYGFVPTLQPTDSFGRIYAVYGGFFIVLSFLAGWILDGDKPDIGDMVGGAVTIVGACTILFWPR